MRNKITGIKYFICFIILSGFSFFAVSFANIPEYSQKIAGQLTQNNYSRTSDIERLFAGSLNLGDCIIYTKVPRGLIVSICSTIFFEEGQDKLLDSSKPVLSKIAQILKFINKECSVESNTAYKSWEKSNYKSNWELSTVRAGKIVDYLIKVEKISPQKINAIGFGEVMPFSSNVHYSNNMDRRIDFVILNYEKQEPLN